MREKETPQICWEGRIDTDAPDLGLTVLNTVQVKRLYTATEGTGTYSHHSYITYYKGKLFATWSNHLRDEDGPGQRVLMSWSEDRGATWAEWEELFPPRDQVKLRNEQDWDEDRVLIANGFAVVNGVLYAVAEVHVMNSRRGFGRIARRIDDGATWTKAVRTNFPDACSRSAVCTLPDGNIAVVNNPGTTRDPLVLSLSADGLKFDRHAVIASDVPPMRYEGAAKNMGFQYPRAVAAEHNLFVMYSVNKEDIEVMTIPLSALSGIC